MSMNIETAASMLENIIKDYSSICKDKHLESEGTDKFLFESESEFISTLVRCKHVITNTLVLYTCLVEGIDAQVVEKNTRDLYKRSGICVSNAIYYRDLKDVFAIIDIAASDKSYTVNTGNITYEEIENIYVAMISMIIKTIQLFERTYGIGDNANGYRTRQRRHIIKEAT